jgi:hypothetical protein
MQRSLFVPLVAVLFLFGCAAPTVYVNHVADAVSLSRTVSIRPLPTTNRAFKLAWVADEGLALMARASGAYSVAGQVDLALIDSALIFAPKEVEELRGACSRMVQALDVKQTEGVDFIQYRLVKNVEETMAQSTTVVTPQGATSDMEVWRGHRVLFALQLTKDAGSWTGPTAVYSFRGTQAEMSIADLRALAIDLQQPLGPR